ncbi:hypothetical protein HHI36_002325 [Cryptolaemus montrouzieri]|uniref:Uncharacterized protein n=1 Tax=Cryptolaemus montrouzieri TaxID=559131 RepID=A0ABD2PA58_9CUCU
MRQNSQLSQQIFPMDDMEKIINDAEIVFNESNLDFTDLLDENEIHSLVETLRMKNRFQYSIHLKNMKILAVLTEECTDVYITEPNIRILDMHFITSPHSQNETTVSEHTDEMKINYTETNIQIQYNVIGEDVQKANVPSPFETVLFWPEEKPEPVSKRKEEKIPSVITSELWQEYHRTKAGKKRRWKKKS